MCPFPRPLYNFSIFLASLTCLTSWLLACRGSISLTNLQPFLLFIVFFQTKLSFLVLHLLSNNL